MKTVLDREPVLFLAALGALIALLVAFGIDITFEQKTAIDVFVAAVLALVARSAVTPVADPRLPGSPT